MTRYLLIGFIGLAACAANTDDPPESTGKSEEKIINGSSSFTDMGYYRQRTVHVSSPQGTCSGTLVLPNVVMTARHCVTTNKHTSGTLYAPSEIRVRMMARAPAPVAPPADDPCTEPNRDPHCSVGAMIASASTVLDMVFVRLAAPIVLNGTVQMFAPIELSTSNAPYIGKSLFITGWGNDTCDGGGGTLRWGKETIVGIDSAATIDGLTETNLLDEDGTNAQGIAHGDSGGPIWGDVTYPAAPLGTANMSKCETLANGESNAFKSKHTQIAANFSDVRDMLAAAAAPRDIASPLDSLDDLEIVDLDGADAKANWAIVGGHIKQRANAGPNVVLVGDTFVQRALGGTVSTTVTSADNDTAGVVFSYVNNAHHMRCQVDDQGSKLQLVAVSHETRVLAETAWSGHFSSPVTITAELTPTSGAGGWDFPIRCRVSGGGVASVSVSARDGGMPAGRVGVYNGWLDDATYTSFRVDNP